MTGNHRHLKIQDHPAHPTPQPPVPGTLPVTIHLSNFTCHNADEDNFYSNGDEPYLFVAAIYADGTTIQLANLANAKVRIKSPSKTHGNLGRTRVKARNSFAIPAATGLFSTSILPIAGLPDNLGKEKSTVGLIVIAMEEDATKTSAANAGQQALVNVLQKELTNAVRTVSALDVDTLRTKLSSAIRQAIKKESLSSITGIFSFVDPDDYIGADFAIWSYQQIENAGSQGMPISMNFKKSGVHYQITGSIRAF
ncbi:hypothetical protein [Leptothermofonsia sp. ETS-13]|uniref:hypothetical protein n=1 Tax=Leptothermofonsia sp. ETS-13 TaxID=3035696 RepID=UPI003BA18309